MTLIYVFIFWQSSHKPRVKRTPRNTATHFVSNQKIIQKVTLLHCALHLFPFPVPLSTFSTQGGIRGVDWTPSHFLEPNPLSSSAKADHIATTLGIWNSAQFQSWSHPSYMYTAACNILFLPRVWKFNLALCPSWSARLDKLKYLNLFPPISI